MAVAGFTTVVQPAARAGPSLRASIDDGKFHGVMAATTPTGWRVVMGFRPATGEGMIAPSVRRAAVVPEFGMVAMTWPFAGFVTSMV